MPRPPDTMTSASINGIVSRCTVLTSRTEVRIALPSICTGRRRTSHRRGFCPNRIGQDRGVAVGGVGFQQRVLSGIDDICAPLANGRSDLVDLGARHKRYHAPGQRRGEPPRAPEHLQTDLLRRALRMLDEHPHILTHERTFASSFRNEIIADTAWAASPSTIRPAFRAGGGDSRTSVARAAAIPTSAASSPRCSRVTVLISLRLAFMMPGSDG